MQLGAVVPVPAGGGGGGPPLVQHLAVVGCQRGGEGGGGGEEVVPVAGVVLVLPSRAGRLPLHHVEGAREVGLGRRGRGRAALVARQLKV